MALIDVYIEKASEKLAGEDRMSATTHAAFAYTGSGYKKLKSADSDCGIRKQGEAGVEREKDTTHGRDGSIYT